MKKLLTLTIAIILSLGAFAGCSSSNSSEESKKTIKVGATPVPHAEILEQAKPLLAAKGYTLEIVEFTDYVTPNTALAEGELDANFFQHIPYLEEFNKEKGLSLVYTAKVHIEPMGIYSNKVEDLASLADGATIAIPNDPSNGARALRVLEAAGLIKVAEGDLVSKLDITENPKNFVIEELEAAMLPRQLENVDAAVINTNYALEADLNPTADALALESSDSPYSNILVARADNKDSEAIKALSEVLNSAEIKKFIEENYKGSIVPAF